MELIYLNCFSSKQNTFIFKLIKKYVKDEVKM